MTFPEDVVISANIQLSSGIKTLIITEDPIEFIAFDCCRIWPLNERRIALVCDVKCDVKYDVDFDPIESVSKAY